MTGFGGSPRGPPTRWGTPQLWRAARRRRRDELLRLHHEMRAAILLPARLGVLGALRTLLTVRDDRDPRRPDTTRGEVVLRGLRATLAQCHIVGVGAALVAVPLDQDAVLGVGLQPLRVRVEHLHRFRLELVPVEVEVDVVETVRDLEAFEPWAHRGGDRRRLPRAARTLARSAAVR